MKRLNLIFNGVDIGCDTGIGRGFIIHHGVGFVIGGAVRIGNNFKCFQGDTIGARNLQLVHEGVKKRSPTVGNDIIVYAGAKVQGPINVGDNSFIGANSVVMGDVPPLNVIPAGTMWKCADE